MNDVVINVTQIVRTVEVNATPNLITITVNSSSGGGTGAVSSVFGRSGAVSAQNGDYNADKITETTSRVFVSPAEKAEIPHENRSVLDLISEAFTTTLKNLYDAAATAMASHITDTDNPHNTTASQVGAYTTSETDSAIASAVSSVNTDATHRDTVKLSQSIAKGQAVYISDANGTNIIVAKASNATEATSSKVIGLLETTGATNDVVAVITDGFATGLNTSSATIGDAVWLGVNGNLIYGLANKPISPAHLVYIGVVSRVHATQGEIIVKVQNGFELKEIHDVLIANAANKQVLSYDTATGLWKNKSVTPDDIVLPAYSVAANNTNVSANGAAETFKAIAEQVYTGTPVWAGATAPSGSTNNSYSWNQIGNLVTLRLNLVYAVAGSSLTSVTIPLPTACPAPFVSSGGTPTANRVIAVGSGIMQTNFAASTVPTYVLLKTNSTNTGFDILAQRSSANYQMVTVTVTYLTT